MKLYISYDGKDAFNLVKYLNKYYRQTGHQVFGIINEIPGGQSWDNSRKMAISECDYFLAIITPAALKQYSIVAIEVREAQRKNKIIIPCIHKDIKYDEIKWGLQDISEIEFTNENELVKQLDIIINKDDKFGVEFAIETGDIAHFIADTIALKYAQKFYGAELYVYSKLTNDLPSLEEFNIPPGNDLFVKSTGSILSKKILFVGVPQLQEFDYPQIREFASHVLKILAEKDSTMGHLAMTINGLGFGKDEIESAFSQFGGIVDALRAGIYPKSLKRITFVNTDKEVVKRLRKSFEEVLVNEQYAAKVNENENWLYQLKIKPQINNETKSTSVTEIDSAGKSSTIKQTIFVAMPFKQEMKNLFRYAIQYPARNAGFICERIDSENEIFTSDIFSNIKKQIDSSSLIIGILTDSNPNVYLEIGYAMGKNKPILFLIKNGDVPKFDLQGFRYFIYENDDLEALEEILNKQLQAFKTNYNKLR